MFAVGRLGRLGAGVAMSERDMRRSIDQPTQEMATLEMSGVGAGRLPVPVPGLRVDVEVTSEYRRVTIEFENPSVSYDAEALTTLVIGMLDAAGGGE